ncbi:profilin-like [Antedon mediterranea]|uniref:profilin-like n=1 Tax=Antedon mediterranea TaxID=105859 RepID=UPI003AF6E18F
MSWDSYIDNLVAQTKDASGTAHSDRACIIGLDGGAPWTTAGHPMALKLQGAEGANIAKCFKSREFNTFMTGGIYVEGEKYQFLREEDKKTVFGKKKDKGALTMQCSKTAIVIGHTAEGCQQGNTNKGVAVIAEYLESLGM